MMRARPLMIGGWRTCLRSSVVAPKVILHQQRRCASVSCLASSNRLSSIPTKTSLRKLPKGELEEQLQELGLDTSGNKEALVGRLLSYLTADALAQPAPSTYSLQAEAGSRGGEAADGAQDLRTQVQRLEEELLDASQRLMAADAARQAERDELNTLTAAMWNLRRDYEEDARQLAGAMEAASDLQRSAAELEQLRAAQAATAERIALLQALLQERDAEIDLLHKQLEEFKVGTAVASVRMAYAAAGAIDGGSGGVALAERPAPGGVVWGALPAAAKPPSAARAGAGRGPFPALGGDAERAEVFLSGPPSRNGTGPGSALAGGAADISKRHAAPGLLVLLGAQGAAGAWATLKRSLPKEQRIYLDLAALAAAAALLSVAAHS